MKKHIKNNAKAFLGLSALLLSSCVDIDKSVSEDYSKARTAPKSALPREELRKQANSNDIFDKDLSLEDLTDIALKNNPKTRVMWLNAKAKASLVGQAEAGYYPDLTLNVGANRTKIRQPSIYQGSSYTSWYNSYGPTLEMNWLLFDFGKRSAQKEVAKQALYASNFEYNQTMQDVLLDVQTSYYNLVSAQASYKASLQDLKDAKTAYDYAEKRYENNIGNKQDLLRAFSYMKNAEFVVESDRANIETQKASLAQNIGLSLTSDIKVEEPKENLYNEKLKQTINDYIAIALKERPTILAKYASYKQEELKTVSAKKDYLPTISATGGLQWLDYGDDDFIGTPYNNYGVGVALEWDIFDGFDRHYRILEQKSKQKAALEQIKQTQLQVISDVWKAYYSFDSSLKQIESTTSALEASEEAFKAVLIGYSNGVNTLTDLIDSQSTLTTARKQKVLAQSNLSISLASLWHSTGSLVISVPKE